jgi:uncharacterized protein (DUF736 family)
VQPEQVGGIADLRATFPDASVSVIEQADGRVLVTLGDVDLGAGWNMARTEVAAFLEVTYPTTPPYPFYAAADLQRADGQPVAGLTSAVTIDGSPRAQLSLRHDHVPGEGLGARFAAVTRWLRTRP